MEEEKKIEVRGLTWGEKKKLKREGYDFRKLKLEEDNDEFAEKLVLMCAMNPEEAKRLIDREDKDGIGVGKVYVAFWEIVKKTFPQGSFVKNSDGLPSSQSMDTSGDVEPVEETG